MTDLSKLFPHASPSFLKANSKVGNTGKASVLESNPGPRTLGEGKAKKEDSGRVHLKFISVRKRTIDPDNLSVKWTTDTLRYCNIIRDDTFEDVTIETSQRKAEKGEQERTILEIYQLT